MSVHKLSFIILLCFSCLAAAASDVKVLRLAHGLNTRHPVHKAMVYMSEKVTEKSDGRMKVEVYPNEQLGNEKECIEAIQLGYLGMTKISSAVLEAFVKEIKANPWKLLKKPRGQ